MRSTFPVPRSAPATPVDDAARTVRCTFTPEGSVRSNGVSSPVNSNPPHKAESGRANRVSPPVWRCFGRQTSGGSPAVGREGGSKGSPRTRRCVRRQVTESRVTAAAGCPPPVLRCSRDFASPTDPAQSGRPTSPRCCPPKAACNGGGDTPARPSQSARPRNTRRNLILRQRTTTTHTRVPTFFRCRVCSCRSGGP